MKHALLIKICSLGTALVITNALHPYIYDLTVLELKDSYSGPKKTFIGLSDYHDKQHPHNAIQRDYVLKVAQELQGRKVQFLVEDLSSASSIGNFGCASYVLNSKQGMLAHLAQDIARINIPVLNLEYRYHRVISCGGLLTSKYTSPYQFQPACSIRIADIHQEMSQLCDLISTYDDWKAHDWYQENINKTNGAARTLKLDKKHDMSVANYVSIMQNRYRQNKYALLRQLLTFDSGLLDCVMVHETIKKEADHEVVIAVAGGTHIENVVATLQTIGFDKKYHAKSSQGPYRDTLCTALAHESCASFVRKPSAIDITVMERFLK